VRRILILAVPALLIPILMARMHTAVPAAPGGKLTPGELREDFAILRGALEEGHAGIYRYTPKAEMDRLFEQAARSLDHPMDGAELFRLAAPVVAAVKCGHTEIYPPETFREEIRRQLLPLEVKVLDGKPYVLLDLANADRRLAGAEIRAVNGVPAEKIVAALLAAAPGDGDIQTSRQIAIGGFHFAEGLSALLGLRSPYEVTAAVRGTGRVETVHLAGADLARLREAAETQSPKASEHPRLDLLDQGRIAVMKLPEFSGLKGFFADAFAEMQAQKTAALILDVRDNGGGDDDLGKLLISYLIDTPFQYYSDLVVNKTSFRFAKYAAGAGSLPTSLLSRGKDGRYHLVNHPNWGLQQPSRPTFRGKVFLLINGGSFSTTAEFLSQAHFHRRATFIGEESGGGYYGNTSGFIPELTLPSSKIRVLVPLVGYYVAVGPGQPAAHGVIPDRPVRYTIDEVLAGRDKEMELALQLARSR
jgi:hypothetical protein